MCLNYFWLFALESPFFWSRWSKIDYWMDYVSVLDIAFWYYVLFDDHNGRWWMWTSILITIIENDHELYFNIITFQPSRAYVWNSLLPQVCICIWFSRQYQTVEVPQWRFPPEFVWPQRHHQQSGLQFRRCSCIGRWGSVGEFF